VILVEANVLQFLLRGRRITVTHRREHAIGRDYAVGVRHNHTVCRARVLSCALVADGFRLELEQHYEEPRVFLARNPGAQRRDYVSRPDQALFGEPEVLDCGRYSLEASTRDDLERRRRVKDRPPSRGRYAPA
jgi:hypothetical protein